VSREGRSSIRLFFFVPRSSLVHQPSTSFLTCSVADPVAPQYETKQNKKMLLLPLLWLSLAFPGQSFAPTPIPERSVQSSLKQFEDSFVQDGGFEVTNPTDSMAVLYREEDDVDCMPPGFVPQTRIVFLISDATGVTARSTLLKSLAQFDTCADETPMSGQASEQDGLLGNACNVQTRTFTFIRSTSTLSQILKTAKEKDACVMYTLADPELRKQAAQMCTSEGMAHVDLMGPSLDVLAGFLGREPFGMPSAGLSGGSKRRALGDSYYQRMDAVEFCLKADDGQSPWLLAEADIVLVGVSRSGKTPLSVVLSQTMSLKVANIPLVLEVPPPSQLLESVDPRRVFCLTIAPTELRKIRTSRLERRNVKKVEAKYEASAKAQSNYADRAYLLKDLKNARTLAEQHNWTAIDVTGRAVEETATIIVEMFNERFQERLSPNSLR
jgi:regulator of PEP synthase PpsR (kinase-PPPase family)